jgi:hypothetical protein
MAAGHGLGELLLVAAVGMLVVAAVAQTAAARLVQPASRWPSVP